MNTFTKYSDEYSEKCLNEIRQLSYQKHSELKDLGLRELNRGGCLILGNSYGKSSRIFCGLNPGLIGEEEQAFAIGPCTDAPLNSPFNNEPDLNRQLPYLRNCQNFMERHHDLGKWFNDGLTSTFLSPWRTKDEAELWALNKATDGRLFLYSGEILSKMLDHHDTELLIIAGKSSINVLNCILSAFDPATKLGSSEFFGAGGTYTWSTSSLIAYSADVNGRFRRKRIIGAQRR
jgi:hypothetical protein